MTARIFLGNTGFRLHLRWILELAGVAVKWHLEHYFASGRDESGAGELPARVVILLPDGTQGNPAPKATIDNVMVKALARAFRWQALLENGTYGCIDEIAKRENIGASFVSKIYRLAFLAPDIVEAILDGKQPAYLTLKDLMVPFPRRVGEAAERLPSVTPVV